jgi:cobalt-zinc-cadmium efflux system protein
MHTHGRTAHGHAHGTHARTAADRRALAAALALVLAFAAVEAAGGVVAGSLALLADAAHMLADGFSLALALAASWLAGRPSTPARSFGYRRAEILAALANGVALVAISFWIFVEAFRRLADPPDVLGGWMLAVAAAGLAVNLVGASILLRADRENLNVRAAFRHVLADVLGSVGVIVAAVVVLATGWAAADPLVGLLIGVLVLASSWTVLRDSVAILLESTPRGIDAEEVGRALTEAPGVVEVHDLHIWEITSGFPALSAHVLVEPDADCHGIRRELEEILHDRFGIEHTTLQVDHSRAELLTIQPVRPKT